MNFYQHQIKSAKLHSVGMDDDHMHFELQVRDVVVDEYCHIVHESPEPNEGIISHD